MVGREIVKGDTYPPLKGETSDENGPVNLSPATSLQVRMRNGATLVTGTATAINPPEVDGVNTWTWQYAWASGDTDVLGVYQVELKVTWASGEIQTFGGTTVEVKAAST